jgi:hypothetical protein
MPKSSNKAAAGVVEIGPDGHNHPPITWRQGVGPHRPYIPPPARANHAAQVHSHAPCSFDIDDDIADHHFRDRMPKMDVPCFDGEHPKLWQLQCEDNFEMYNKTLHM